MAGSPAYARIKADVLAIAAALPPGKVTTHTLIGAKLSVQPRHVAFILATLGELERETVPWHRVVAQGGAVGRHQRRDDQIARLKAEGVPVSAAGIIVGLEGRLVVNYTPSSRPKARQAAEEPGASTAEPDPPAGPAASRARGRFDRPGTRLK